MKKLKLLSIALATVVPDVTAQVVVVDPTLVRTTAQNHVEEMHELSKLTEEAATIREWLGNPADYQEISGASDVLGDLETTGAGRSRLDLATSATSRDALAYTGAGLYQSVGSTFTTRNGREVRRSDAFKPEDAVFKAVLDHDAVHEDVQRRRDATRFAIQQTLTQLQAATTHTESQKAAGVLIAQNADLAAIDRELQFALERIQTLEIQNRAERERNEKASREEQAAEFKEGLRLFAELVRPPNFSVPKPITRR